MNQPNIILILTDHFRRDALGPHTPALLRLAASGTRFANAYCAAPLCQPARTSLIAGMYPSATGICGNQSDPMPVSLRDDTFMHHLRGAGYHTALIGKHHYLDNYGLGVDATDQDEEVRRYGFDFVFQVADDSENSHNDDEYTHHLAARGLLETFRAALAAGGLRHPFSADDSADGFIGRRGIRFVEEVGGDRPFYLNLSFIGPHPPYWNPEDPAITPITPPAPVGAEDSPRTCELRGRYLQKCALIDRYVGELVEVLQRRGLYEKTVILFTSDHGDMLGDFGIWDKRYFYEASVGVPLLFCGPGVPAEERMNGPRLSRLLISHLDLYPTLLRLAGIEPPKDRRRPGRDLLGMARGDVVAHDAIYAELATCAMIRTGNWKLVFDPEQGGVQQLFNLVADPQELHNLAGQAGYEHTTLELVGRLLAHRIRLTQFTHVKEEQRLQRVRLS